MEKANKLSGDQLKEVKEILANTAVAQLEKDEDFGELANTEVEFGYIYSREDNYESLFKIITDKKTVFLQHNEGNLYVYRMLYRRTVSRTVEQMKEFHGDWL